MSVVELAQGHVAVAADLFQLRGRGTSEARRVPLAELGQVHQALPGGIGAKCSDRGITRTLPKWRIGPTGRATCTHHPRGSSLPTARRRYRSSSCAAAVDGLSVRPAGSRHSFTPLCATDGVAVDLHGLSGVEAIDVEACTATVLAGTRLSEIGDELRAAGLALHNQGDVDTQTVSGATGTGTHGTGPDLGNLSTAISAVRIATADGEIVFGERGRPFRPLSGRAPLVGCARDHHCDHVPLCPCVQPPRAGLVRRPRRQHGEALRTDRGDAPLRVLLVPVPRPVRAQGTRAHQRAARPALRSQARTDRPLPSRVPERARSPLQRDGVRDPGRMRGRPCFAEHPHVVPRALSRRAVAGRVPHRRGRRRLAVTRLRRATVTISVHEDAAKPYEALFADCEAVFRAYDGRPHWGKIHGARAEHLAAEYEHWDHFWRLRAELDPEGRFLNEHLRTIGGVAD